MTFMVQSIKIRKSPAVRFVALMKEPWKFHFWLICLRNFETMQNGSRLLVLSIGERIRFYYMATIARTLLLAVYPKHVTMCDLLCIRALSMSFISSGGTRGDLIFRPNWGPKGCKKCFGDSPPSFPAYLKVWIRHWLEWFKVTHERVWTS